MRRPCARRRARRRCRWRRTTAPWRSEKSRIDNAVRQLSADAAIVKPSRTPTGRSTSSISFAPTPSRPSSRLLARAAALTTPASSAGPGVVPMAMIVTFDVPRDGVKRGIQRCAPRTTVCSNTANATLSAIRSGRHWAIAARTGRTRFSGIRRRRHGTPPQSSDPTHTELTPNLAHLSPKGGLLIGSSESQSA